MERWEWNEIAARYMAYWPATAQRFGDETIGIWFERLQVHETERVLRAIELLSREPNDYGPSLGRVEDAIYQLDGARPAFLDAVRSFERGLGMRPQLGEPETAKVERALFVVEEDHGGLAREFVERHWQRIRASDLAPGRFALRDLEREWAMFFNDAAREDRLAAATFTTSSTLALLRGRDPAKLGGGRGADGIAGLLQG